MTNLHCRRKQSANAPWNMPPSWSNAASRPLPPASSLPGRIPTLSRQWYVPGDDWETADYENDFSVGGRQLNRFGPKGDPKYSGDGRYLDIVPEARIVSAGAMHDGNTRISATLCTVELLAEGSGTRLILTDQSAFFDGRETPSGRNRAGAKS